MFAHIRRPFVSVIAVVLIAGGCSPSPEPTTRPSASVSVPGPSASPSAIASPTSPAATASPSASPTAAPAELQLGWSYTARTVDVSAGWFNRVAFASDGSIVTAEVDSHAQLVSVDRIASDGSVVPGWPWRMLNAHLVDIALVPDGTTYVIAGVLGDLDSTSWSLHRLDAHGQEMAGFPVRLQDDETCSLAVAADGTAVTRCAQEFEPANWISTVTAVGLDGHVGAGWPVRITGAAGIAGFLPDGTIVLGVNDWVAATDSTVARVVELRPDGTPAPGWHVTTFPGYGNVFIDPAGRVGMTIAHFAGYKCPATQTTSYVRLADDGRTARGWPIRIQGWGSDPMFRDDGSMVVAASGGRVRAWSLAGHTLPGWPLSGIDVASCGDSPVPGSMPVAVGDGAVVVLGRTRATRLQATGAVAAGWPVTPADPPASACPTCPPSSTAPLLPVSGRAGVYVPVYEGGTPARMLDGRPGILLLGADGRVVAGRPHVAGDVGEQLLWVRIAPDGRVWMALRRRVEYSYWSDRLVLLGDDAGSP